MKFNKKIIIIAIYIGNLPKYFDLWLNSCGNNTQIDFLLFTNTHFDNPYNNVKSVFCELSMIKELAEKKLDMNIWLETPYKLCDYKPAYGLIFEDYIKEYDYWGYCDIDLIFGDICGFLIKYDFEKFDKFLDKGHLSLYRNTPDVNNLFRLDGAIYGNKQKITYKEVFSTDRNWIYDETNGIDRIIKQNNYSLFEQTIYADVLHLWKRMKLWNLKNYSEQLFYYKDGKIYRYYWVNNNMYREEYIYIHYQKRNFDIEIEYEKDFPHDFFVGSNGIKENYKKTVLKEDVKKINPYYGKIREEISHTMLKIIDRFRIYKKAIWRRCKGFWLSQKL